MGTTLLRSVLFVAAAAASAIAVEPGATRDEFILTNGKNATLSASSADEVEHAQKLAAGREALWTRRDGKEYLILDAKIVTRARALMAPVDELAKPMNAWGKQMQELALDPERNSNVMSALGKKMGAQGKKIEAAAHEMERKMYALIDEARAAGLAQPVP